MSYRILILGASYGSLLGTKLIAAGHDVTLVCRDRTAALINENGTEVRIKLRDEDDHRSFRSGDLAGKLDATTPEKAQPQDYDLVCLAMQEPQYAHPSLRGLLGRVADARVPCMSIMNMPPLPYLRRIPGLDCDGLGAAFQSPEIWARFDPALVTLCSPDPQAFRPPEEAANVLHVGLPTNFKVTKFHDAAHDAMLAELEQGIDNYRIDGKDVPVKLRVYDSLFVPFAKWSMLATGNYRCITPDGPRAIRDAVHGDPVRSEEIYNYVRDLVVKLGADPADMVPFEKYAKAAENLLKPSSAARAVYSGATAIERVDKLIMLAGRAVGMGHPDIDATVALVDTKLSENLKAAG
ncbi:2-dehydropantoate 2-reductase N-terminal domain-containing protein [Sedimentitalea sp. JM2-8]|uniref:2-dehydropantoate 2-reductase N-terminal domain-containing protein n=1 Tax=Sedimentitalea xiamensis TaxID=3050037 RepID=A0ABT7FLI7_9RHOB|nr:2-dehydropantoate 2-reductase N-terminal domain-containing protein [Sedimentitalea xiamensis]MDK3075845.1 2-dehydropantoate 2-reductase N-terminal domain-containing protein [Sedimentitalea xiamensis]